MATADVIWLWNNSLCRPVVHGMISVNLTHSHEICATLSLEHGVYSNGSHHVSSLI